MSNRFPRVSIQRVCHDTLPWLILFSLGGVRTIDTIAAANADDDHRCVGITIRHDGAPNDAPFGRLWYDTPDNAIGYAQFYSRSQHAVIRVLR